MEKKQATNMEVKKKTEITFFDISAGMEPFRIRISHMI